MKMRNMAMVLALGLASTGAHAATITFDLIGADGTGFNDLPTSFSMTQGGLMATFDAKSIKKFAEDRGVITGGTVNDARIGRYAEGAGVMNSLGDGSASVDGAGWDDFIQITFSEAVTITEISFGDFDAVDDFRILTDLSGNSLIGLNDGISSDLNVAANNPFSGFGEPTDIFAVGAFGVDDTWLLKSVTVQFGEDEGNGTAVVPVPAAGWLMLSAIAGLGVMRRRKGS